MTSMESALATLDPASQEVAKAMIRQEQLILIDRLVRAARTESWCGEFERSMAVIFPDGHPVTGRTDYRAWTDSDGFTCRGVDADGYMMDGFHTDTGLDREGYSRRGYNYDGYDREGFNRDGFNAEGFNRAGLDSEGYTRDGRDAAGNLRGTPEAEAFEYRFDDEGYDADGYNYRGVNRRGMTREQWEGRFRYNRNGYSRP